MADEIDNEENAPQGNKKSGLKAIIVIVAVIILIELAVVSYIIISVKSKGEMPTSGSQHTENVQNMPTGEVIQMTFSDPINLLVNVKGTSGERYFKTTLIIEYNGARYPQMGGFININLPRFQDIAINVLSSKDINVLDNYKARDNIRNDLMIEFSKILPEGVGKIDNILINEWLIQ